MDRMSRLAHADGFDDPAPSPAVAEERDGDPRGGAEDHLTRASGAGLTVFLYLSARTASTSTTCPVPHHGTPQETP